MSCPRTKPPFDFTKETSLRGLQTILFKFNENDRLKFLKDYYFLEGGRDAYLYALYLHDGRPSRLHFSYPFYHVLIHFHNRLTIRSVFSNIFTSIYEKFMNMLTVFGEKPEQTSVV
jgi:hypothetical protein